LALSPGAFEWRDFDGTQEALPVESPKVNSGSLELETGMGFSVKKDGDTCVVQVEGQLIVGNRQELKQRVLDELERGERKFLVDFRETGYIDSSGLGVLVSLSKRIRELDGELRLSNLNEDLRSLFELTKLDTLFQIA